MILGNRLFIMKAQMYWLFNHINKEGFDFGIHVLIGN